MKIRRLFFCILTVTASILCGSAQTNTDQVMRIGRNALYFEDYILSIQYFNLAIQAKPYLAQPYFYRSIAKLNLEDYRGAEEDASVALQHNPFITDAYEVRGVARQNQGKLREAIADYTQALSMLPENRQIMFNKAMAEDELRDFEAARKSFDALLAAHPNYDNAYIGRAKLLMEQGDTTAARNDLDKALSLNKNAFNAYILRSNIAINSGKDFAAALADMNEAIKLQPKFVGLFVNRAFLRYNLDDYFGAMADYDYALELDPANAVAYYNRGLLRAEVRDNNKAIDDFSHVIALDPTDVRARFNRAMLRNEIRDYNGALEDLDIVIGQYPDFAGAYSLRSELYRGLNDMRKAEADYNRAMALIRQPAGTDAGGLSADDNRISTGTETAQNDNRPTTEERKEETQEQVAARFKQLLTVENNADIAQEFNNSSIRGRVQDRDINIEIEPLFTLSFYSSPTELSEGTYYLKEIDDLNATRMLRFLVMLTNHEPTLNDEAEIRKHFESIEYYTSIISSRQPRAIDYFGRAMDFMTIRNYRSAINDLNKAVELTPDFTLGYFLRAIARYRQMQLDRMAPAEPIEGDIKSVAAMTVQTARATLAEIMTDFDTAIRLSPRMAPAYFNKGNLLLETGDLTSALSAFNKAIELKPDLGEAYYNRGYTYFRLGNKEAGSADLSKAGELGILPSYNLLKRMNR